jgi:hypothetical protein
MKIVAARAVAIVVMLLVLGAAHLLDQFVASKVAEGCLLAGAVATLVLVLARG